ncbi:hypothetical protein ACFYWY_00525 [Streptomyces sp. NPDC002870]|uniref:hypothetical protein n=1 Tax=Streptomyces sp. NPDC002870 TaxID=3364666 RepID=UPI003693148C
MHQPWLEGVRPRVAAAGLKFLEAWLLSEQIIGCLLAKVVDAMSGMVTKVRPPWRDEMNAYYRALPLCAPGQLHPNRHSGDANA